MNPELLATWYLRLNGFFTTPSYIVHPTRRGGMVAEVDVAGVRFPFRQEFPSGPGEDDVEITSVPDGQPLVVLAEATRMPCKVNSPWADPDNKVFERIATDLGLVQPSHALEVAAALRATSLYISAAIVIRIVCIGGTLDEDLRAQFPLLPQRTWNDVGQFSYRRFKQYRKRKSDHSQWDAAGTLLWQRAQEASSASEFCSAIGADFGVDAE